MHCTVVQPNQTQSKESLTANQLYMSSVLKQWATSQFWNLYCKAASPAKAIFNLLLGCGPQLFSFTKKATRCYVKRQWRVCLVCDPRNMQFFLVQKVRVRHCSYMEFGRFLIRTHWDDMDTTEHGWNERHLSSDTLCIQQEREMLGSRVCCYHVVSIWQLQNRMCFMLLRQKREFTVLIKARQNINERCAKWELWSRRTDGGGNLSLYCWS